ncbi:MAG: lipopolysaccharide assembly protein LapA domain-containing protein [Dehalococcoidia bacterium]
MKDDVTESGLSGARLRLIGGGAALGLLLLFLLQNLQDAEINFLWFEWNIPVIWALLASAAIGAVAAFAFSTLRGRRPKT